MPVATPNTIEAAPLDYEHDGTRLVGFLARDAAVAGRRPGVLVFPEWWRLDGHAKARARRLAGLGYVALAADVYGVGRVIDTARPADAAGMAAALRTDIGAWRGRAGAALRQLRLHPAADAANVAAIGYCLDSALQLAYAGADLKAVAAFHSALPTPSDAEAKAIRAEVLVCLGGDDPFVPEDSRADFRASLAAAGVRLDFVAYPGVVHSFTSPDAGRVGNPGLRYDEAADADSWRRMRELLAAAFGEPARAGGP